MHFFASQTTPCRLPHPYSYLHAHPVSHLFFGRFLLAPAVAICLKAVIPGLGGESRDGRWAAKGTMAVLRKGLTFFSFVTSNLHLECVVL